jgi:hypothetical protein
MTAPTDEEIHYLMLKCADTAYFDGLRAGKTGAEALRLAVKAAVTEDRRCR